ncbi:response regulator transcription factor [Flavobacterium pallidum]|uniref:DNA-binding response regulator n=1 Tax=Flavobacterium pallidum TaxID=2172098 RepID=A0A2S1SK92_9FLAO|nr:response regulator transcription factor [Flavobacterium pallidum]AWI26789.1 hypothetical protein HYN49_13275 [Flavobacterium pallidum]
MMIKVGIIGDSMLHRKSLLLAINLFGKMQAVVDAPPDVLLMNKLRGRQVDVVVLDLHHTELSPLTVCEMVKRNLPSSKLLVIDHAFTIDSAANLFAAGATGIITPGIILIELKAAISTLFSESAVPAELEHLLLLNKGYHHPEQIAAQKPAGRETTFTKREIEVIRLIGHEMTSTEIARKLNVAHSTIETHRQSIMEKTGSKNFIGVLIYALRNNYIHIDDLPLKRS